MSQHQKVLTLPGFDWAEEVMEIAFQGQTIQGKRGKAKEDLWLILTADLLPVSDSPAASALVRAEFVFTTVEHKLLPPILPPP